MRLLVVSTPVGPLGSGRGGGVELTLEGAARGLTNNGVDITVLAPDGSNCPWLPSSARLIACSGEPQDPMQQSPSDVPINMPADGVLQALWEQARSEQQHFDRILNLAYDWLPLWLTDFFDTLEEVRFVLYDLGYKGGTS